MDGFGGGVEEEGGEGEEYALMASWDQSLRLPGCRCTTAAIWPDGSTVCMRNKKEREPSDSKTNVFGLDTCIEIWHSAFWGPCIATNECSVRRTPSLATKVSRD